MAVLGQRFDATQHNTEQNDYPELPNGVYMLEVEASDVGQTKKGDGTVLKVTNRVIEPATYEGRKLFVTFNLQNPSPDAQRIGQQQFASLCRAIGATEVEDSEELHFRSYTAKIGLGKPSKDGQYPARAEIKRYYFPDADDIPEPHIEAANDNAPPPAAARTAAPQQRPRPGNCGATRRQQALGQEGGVTMQSLSAATIADRYISRDGGAPAASADAPPEPTVGHNAPPEPTPYEAIRDEIEDLFLEAKNWADGEPIAAQPQADAVTALLDMVNDAIKRADAARVEENKPFDEGKAEVQARYNGLIGKTKSVTGRAVMAKEALQGLLTPWRQKLEDERRAEAARLAKEAAEAAAAAQAAMQPSRGDLEAREKAEDLYQAAQDIERVAKRADKAATTKTGLRSVWRADLVDAEAALDWAYGYAPEQFTELVQSIADKAVFGGLRKVPGFVVTEERVAR